ncbi:MAG: hypothetical protein GQ576_07105 [Methanococcoides sp.]|nr:hypothetical protein [Methanococcoides sp.]
MAKFLPFVVEKSTPIHIFQTLISRSKGLNQVLVASILYLVLEKGIGTVRDKAAELPDTNLDKLYEQLIIAYPSYLIPTEQFSRMQSLVKHMELWDKKEVATELEEYPMEDILNFLLVMLLVGKEKEYTSLDFNRILNGDSDVIEKNIIDHNLFSNDGEDYYFDSKEDLAAYIWCNAVISTRKEGYIPVKAVYYPGKPNAVPKGKRAKTRFDKESEAARNKTFDTPEADRNNSEESYEPSKYFNKEAKFPSPKFGGSPWSGEGQI